MIQRFKRLMICFDAEDPQKWGHRLLKALDKKEKSLVKLKYNYFIDKMRDEGLNPIEPELKQRIIQRVGIEGKFRGIDSRDLIEEMIGNYFRSMNKLVFDQNFSKLPPVFRIKDIEECISKKNQKPAKDKGLVQFKVRNIPPIKDEKYEYARPGEFQKLFKDFCFSSLFIKEESIKALQEIKKVSQPLQSLKFFTTVDEGGVKRLDEFRTIQESAISQSVNHLRNIWVQEMIEIIKKKFSDVGKGWFNIKETNRLTYEFGKLRRFLTLVRLYMQDQIRGLLKKNLRELVDYFQESTPESVEVIDESCVKNSFKDGRFHRAILSLDVVQVGNKDEFNYLFKVEKIKADLLGLFEKVVEELKRIPDLEPKILESLHKARKGESYVLAPVLPKDQPEEPESQQIPKRYADENKWLWELHEEFKEILQKATAPLENFKTAFDKYQPILQMKPEEVVAKIEGDESGRDISFVKGEIIRWQQEEKKLKERILEEVHVGCFQINCKEAIRILLGKYQEVNKKLIDMLVRSLKETLNGVQKKLGEIETDLNKAPESIEQLVDIRTYVKETLPICLEKVKDEMKEAIIIYELLESQGHKLPKEDLNKRWKLIAGPAEIYKLVTDKEKTWDKLKVKFEEQLSAEQSEFVDAVETISNSINSFHLYNNLNEYEEMEKIVIQLQSKLEEVQSEAKLYNAREQLVGKGNITDYVSVGQLGKLFLPYLNLWKNVSCWMTNQPKWINDPWDKIDAASARLFVEDGYKALLSSLRFFKEKEKTDNGKYGKLIELLKKVKKEIDEFKQKVPLLVALKKEGMKDRHWTEISDKVGFIIEPKEGTTFQTFLDKGLIAHTQICVDISEKASREFSIERQLREMKAQWETVNFELSKYKETGCFVVTNFETVENLLDAQLSDAQMLVVNPFRKPFAEEIEKWYDTLLLVSNVVEEWRRFQAQWGYLQPIFDSSDINKQLPNESALFKRIDQNWRTTITQTRVQKKAMLVCTGEGYLDKFRENNATLDRIQKELKSYLELKRSKFGRFYFLSNDDLLLILSQTKDVEKVQDHLRKVFENITRLQFTPEKKIEGMYSVEQEFVKFDRKAVDPNLRQVEDWMSDVEEAMKNAVNDKLIASVKNYAEKKRNDWILLHPGQCVLNGSQVVWTIETEKAIESNQIRSYFEFLESQLQNLVLIERSCLSRNQLVTIEALIVIDVHAKDVIEKLVRSETTSVTGFDWISQLRYYIEDQHVTVKCLQTKLQYGCEYLGNTPRLVITPLTDKCYMTLMSALQLNLGGAPAGPAGTGKTETTKDLAKAVAKQCVVFNCQESMDYQFVGKFFKGLANSGAWCCFDEFNRINLEVLSVVAQQLQELFRAKSENLKILLFEGSEIKIDITFSVFITMNPGYAGRTELPDNLKALFRSVAMMVPDYALIAEIKLYSFGFIKARELARKMVATFKLSSEQLSSQHHYDYGMRAVTSVINAAGLLKTRDRANTPEDQILLQSLQDVNLPKFLKDDLPLFANITKDLFPETLSPSHEYGTLPNGIKKACIDMGLQPIDAFMGKVLQLYDTTQVRHGLMLVGPTAGGKTSSWKVLQNALSHLSNDKQNKGKFSKVNVEVINPKALSMSQLYGEYREMNWNEGILELVFEKAINTQFDTQRTGEEHWIMFDGPVDALWIESMNTVLDDNKKLCLSSGKVLIMSNKMVMMFEVEDLAVASPATVSRCGMVYLEPENLGPQILIKSFLNSFDCCLTKNILLFENLNKTIIDISLDLHQYVLKNCKEITKTPANNLISSFCRIFKCFLEENLAYLLLDKTNQEEQQVQIEIIERKIINIILFCSIWSIGASVDDQSRRKISTFLNTKIKNYNINQTNSQILQNNPIYDLIYNVEFDEWRLWTPNEEQVLDVSGKSFGEITIPTIDSIRMIYLTQILLKNNYHVLTPGITGTGKSTNAYHLLSSKLGEDFISTSMVLSAQTNEGQIVETVFSQMGKRKRGLYGPPSGKKMVILIDDLNMPKKEEYGAQPPIELLRMFLDHKAWYIWKMNKEYTRMEDLTILGAMGPSGTGRSDLTPRFLRHFSILAYPEQEQKVIAQIFSTLLKGFLRKFSIEIKDQIDILVNGSILLYLKIKSDLLPIPGKSHYQFNVRDLSRLFAGICLCTPKVLTNQSDLLNLWTHETNRVFSDRLIDDKDRKYLQNQIKIILQTYFNYTQKEQTSENRLIFSDFNSGIDERDRIYSQVTDFAQFTSRLNDYQEEYNQDSSRARNRLSLVLFLDACEHISRICRVLRQPQGHLLLLGVGGSGKQSLCRLSTFIANQRIFSLEIGKGYNSTKWREDLKKVIYAAVVENKPISFLLTDTQLVLDEMMEDVNCLLNTGIILNLGFNSDELKKIEDIAKAECHRKNLVPNKINLFDQQVQRVKANTHMEICMSPLGKEFNNRLRMFPALINCCTIDWFQEWPDEALEGVAKEFISNCEEEYAFKNQTNLIVEFFKHAHKFVEKISSRFREVERRFYFVTPTSFLELLKTFKQLLAVKTGENEKALKRLQTGVQRLKEANENVDRLQVELKNEEPTLKKTEEEVSSMLETIRKDKLNADHQKELVAKEETEAKIAQENAEKLANRMKSEVADADKELAQTLEKVGMLGQEHLNELKVLPESCPVKLKYVSIAACILMLDPSQIIVKNSWTDEETEAYFFRLSKNELVKDPTFLHKLRTIDYQKVESYKIKKIREMVVDHPKRSKVWVDELMLKSNLANYCLFLIVNSVIKFNELFEKTKPLRKLQQEALEELKSRQIQLEEKNNELALINANLDRLEQLLKDKNKELADLKAKIESCSQKLERAKKLTSLLFEENDRWNKDIGTLQEMAGLIEGNILLASGMLAYAGPFSANYRNECLQSFKQKLKNNQINFTEKFNLRSELGQEGKIQNWSLAGLPKDEVSVENGIIIESSLRWPFIIDPQKQSFNFIKNIGKKHEEGFEIVKVNSNGAMKILEQCVQFGKWLAIENCQATLESAFEPVLLKQTVKSGGSLQILLGEKLVPYSEKFKLVLFTNLSNPNFSPETCAKVSIVNFSVTPNGLEEQMLATVVFLENRQLEDQKNDIVRKNASDKETLMCLEDDILKILSESNTDFLENPNLISQLSASKKTATEIKQRVEDSKITEEKIDTARENYRSLAKRASLLFFATAQLAKIDHMYEFSLEWFNQLFRLSVEETPLSNVLYERLSSLISKFALNLYKNVCRSLFEKHKLLFSFLLGSSILQDENILEQEEVDFLVNPKLKTDDFVPENPSFFISDNNWPLIYRTLNAANSLKHFQGLTQAFLTEPEQFKSFAESQNPQDQPIPPIVGAEASQRAIFKLTLVRIFRPDKFLQTLSSFLSKNIGPSFVENQSVLLKDVFPDTSCLTPLIIVFMHGSDPKADFDKLVEQETVREVLSISLGQGQGSKAERIINEATRSGSWVILQNCHLSASWMKNLEAIVLGLSPSINKDFRLFLTTAPSEDLPLGILQTSVRIAMEAPQGLKSTLIKCFSSIDPKEFSETTDTFKKLLYGLSFFHSIVNNRKFFGAIGWNIPYQFTFEDFTVSRRQLASFLTEYKQIPFKVLNFVCAEINYGGRVTDDKDLRLIKTLLRAYVCPEILKDSYKFSESGKYSSFPVGDVSEYIEKIQNLPSFSSPEVFFLHDNAEISTNENSTREFLETVLATRVTNSNTGEKTNPAISLIASLLEQTPKEMDYEEIIKLYPTKYSESMNTVLTQEILRYNKIINLMRVQLIQLQKAIRGEQVMSTELDNILNALLNQQVPVPWQYPLGFLSLKSLPSWIDDFKKRVDFLMKWVNEGKPTYFWISGFFFPQAFITGTLQNFARSVNIAIDRLSFEIKVRDDLELSSPITEEFNGVLVYGIYLEGASWNNVKHCIKDPKQKELYSSLPILQLSPVIDRIEPIAGYYNCPMYKVVSRAGTLSTTGHSTNFVMFVEMTSDENEDYWTRRGVAAFLSLRY